MKTNDKYEEDNENLVVVPYVTPKTNFRDVYSNHETYEEDKKSLIETFKSWDNKMFPISDVILQKHKMYQKNYELIRKSMRFYDDENGKIIPFELSLTRGKLLILKLCYPWKEKWRKRLISIVASKICLYISYSR